MDDFLNFFLEAPAYVKIVILLVTGLIYKFGPKNLFRFSGRLSRSSYISCLVFLLIIAIIYFFTFSYYERNHSDLIFALAGIMYFCIEIINLSIVVRRLRDIDLSPWLLVLCFVAAMGLYIYDEQTTLIQRGSDALTIILLVIPGTKGPNKYGPDPLETLDYK